MSRATIKAHRRITSANGVVTNEAPHFLLRAVGGTCVEDRAAFSSLEDADKPNLPATMPTPASGYYWAIKECGNSAITVDLSNSDFDPDVTGGGEIEVVAPLPGDPASYGITSSFTY